MSSFCTRVELQKTLSSAKRLQTLPDASKGSEFCCFPRTSEPNEVGRAFQAGFPGNSFPWQHPISPTASSCAADPHRSWQLRERSVPNWVFPNPTTLKKALTLLSSKKLQRQLPGSSKRNRSVYSFRNRASLSKSAPIRRFSPAPKNPVSGFHHHVQAVSAGPASPNL